MSGGEAAAVLDAPGLSVGLAETARLRQGAYRLFAALFLYPDAARLDQIVAAAHEFRQYDPVLARFASFSHWRQLLTVLTAPLDGGLPTLEGEYTRLFLVDPHSLPCPAYETFYRERNGEARGWVEGQLQQAYLTGGVVVEPGLGELPDHIAVELEFMAHLCDQEAAAWEAVGATGELPHSLGHLPRAPAEAVPVLTQQRAFLDLHLGAWFPAFAQRVLAAGATDLYRTAATAAGVFIQHDRDIVALLLERVHTWNTTEPAA